MKPRKVWPLLFRPFLLKSLSYLLLSKDVPFYRVGRVLFRAGTPPIWVVRQKFCTGGFGLIIDSKSKIQSTKWLWNSISFLILRQKVPDLPHPWKMWGGILWSISLISNETFGAAQKTSVSLWDCTLSTIFYNQASWKFKTQLGFNLCAFMLFLQVSQSCSQTEHHLNNVLGPDVLLCLQ